MTTFAGISRVWMQWVRFLDERESPLALALVRMGVAAVLLYDLVEMRTLDLVAAAWAPDGFGVGEPLTDPSLACGIATLAAATLFVGFATRVSAAVLLLALAALAEAHPLGDRGIDVLLRNVLAVLAFSEAGATLSVDALVRHRRWRRNDALVHAWPRRALVLQLVWLYFCAGLHKTQLAWTPLGGFSALSFVLRDPHFARTELGWLPYALTQLGTAITMAFELSAPFLLLAYRDLRTPETAGRLRRVLRRIHFRRGWIATGVVFHLLLLATVRLGIFPLGVLAIYPALLSPVDLRGMKPSRA